VAAIVAVLVLAVTVAQVVRVVRLSRLKTELNGYVKRDKTEADYRTAEAAKIRRGLDQKQLALVAAEAKEANQLIAQRTFSWTQLLNYLTDTLPNDVMLTSIRPEFDGDVTRINMDIQGKGGDEIDKFWENLEKTGAFSKIAWSGLTDTDEGVHRLAMTAEYTGARQ
jgi:Tfp pilus assembly protein PilN